MFLFAQHEIFNVDFFFFYVHVEQTIQQIIFYYEEREQL